MRTRGGSWRHGAIALVVAVTTGACLAGGDLGETRAGDPPGGSVATVVDETPTVPAGWRTLVAGGLAVSVPPDWDVDRPWSGAIEGPVGGPCAVDLARPIDPYTPSFDGPTLVVFETGTDGSCDADDETTPRDAPTVLLHDAVRVAHGPRVDLVAAWEDGVPDRIGDVEVLRLDLADGTTRYVATHQTGGLWVTDADDPVVRSVLATVRPAAGIAPGSGDPGAVVLAAGDLDVTVVDPAMQGARASLVMHADELPEILADVDRADRPSVGPDEVLLDLHPGDGGPSYACPRVWDLAEIEVIAGQLEARFVAADRRPCVPNGERHLVVVPRALVADVGEAEVVTRWERGLPPTVAPTSRTLGPGEFEVLEVHTTRDASLPAAYAIDVDDLDAVLGRAGLSTTLTEVPEGLDVVVVTARDLEPGTCPDPADVVAVESRDLDLTLVLDAPALAARRCPSGEGWPVYVVAVPPDVPADTYAVRLADEAPPSTDGPRPPAGTVVYDPEEVVLRPPDDVVVVGTYAARSGTVARADTTADLAELWALLEVAGTPPEVPEGRVALVASAGPPLGTSCLPAVELDAVVIGDDEVSLDFGPAGGEACPVDSEEILVVTVDRELLTDVDVVTAGMRYS